MKIRTALLVVVVVALAIGAWALFGAAPSEPARLLPAWQLLDDKRYAGEVVADSFVSWSPDSNSVVFSEHEIRPGTDVIYRWEIGAKRLEKITSGVSPNYLEDGRSFIYLKTNPKAIFRYDLSTGKETEAVTNAKNSQFWKKVSAIRYDPSGREVSLRLGDFTPRPNWAGERYDLNGKYLGEIKREKGVEVVDYSEACSGDKCALVIQNEEGASQALRLVPKGQDRGRQIESGNIGAVAWSPDGKSLAYSRDAELRLLPESGTPVTIGRFGVVTGQPTDPYVGRLLWSPNGRYLAALVIAPNAYRDQPRIFILDTAKISGLGR